MGIKPGYKPHSKAYVIDALALMIDNLRTDLKIDEEVSFKLDTMEEHRKVLESPSKPMTEEELDATLQQSRDRTIRNLGHIQKRIDEVEWLKRAFEAEEVPPPAVLKKTFDTLRSSLLYETMHLAIHSPCKEVVRSGVAGLSTEKAEEIQQRARSIIGYSEALWFGFDVVPLAWNEFPFDTV